MRYTEIAIAKPFEGAPKINLPDLFGASPKKPLILRVPVTGKRPIDLEIKNLPKGLELNGMIITGKVEEAGDYEVIVTAKNALGEDKKTFTFEIKENNVIITPLLGFTSWNAFGDEVTEENMIDMAHKFDELGLCEYGYSYINTDSGWQGEYGGKHDAIMPNKKFPDMKKMTDEIHALGLKCGIYSAPTLVCWGCPKWMESVPGCTQGEPDVRFTGVNGGIGKIRKEKNNVAQWTEWGFDYLKYDWMPSDPYNAEIMRQELINSERDFGFCVTLKAEEAHCGYWTRYCNSYRCNPDALGNWPNLLKVYETYEGFLKYNNKGHYFDMDMLDTGTCRMDVNPSLIKGITNFSLTEDEQLVAYSIRAFFGSPIQISSTLENINEFELSMYCNEEVIAINQDSKFSPAKPLTKVEKPGGVNVHSYKKQLSDGSFAICVFNLGETAEKVEIYLDEVSKIRDVWAKKDMGESDLVYIYRMPPHTVRILKISK